MSVESDRKKYARKRQAKLDALLAAEPKAQWLPVEGHPDYFVSDDGRVRRGPFLLRGVIDDHGYPAVYLGRGQKRTHQLVARAFLGPPPPGCEVRHLNDIKTDNSIGNLAYGTRRDNALDMVRNGLHPGTRKTHCKRGHPFTEENTYLSGQDGRQRRCCRTCRRMHSLDYFRRKKAAQ